MRKTIWLAAVVLLTSAAFAQRGGGPGRGGAGRGAGAGPGMRSGGAMHGGGTWGGGSSPNAWQGGRRHFGGSLPGVSTYSPNFYGSTHGFGNVVFPGTGHAPGTFSPFSIVDPSFGTRLSNTVSGFGYPYSFGNSFNGFGYGQPGRRSTTVVVPYTVPIYVPYQEPQPPPPPQIIYVVPADPTRMVGAPMPPMQREGVTTYIVPPRNNEATESAPAPASRRIYLIALSNSSIYSATDYWVEDDTLHYVTTSGAHNQVSLNLVDLEFTIRLNRERGIDFRLER